MTALGDKRITAVAKKLARSKWPARAAAPLSLRFDAKVYESIFKKDDAYLTTSLLALPGAPAVPILHEAGVMLTDWRGSPDPSGERVLAAPPNLHAELLRITSREADQG